MKKFTEFILTIAFLLSTSAYAQNFKFIALGDMPYSLPGDFDRFSNLIEEINYRNPSFSLFIGDTKSGSTPCTNEYNQIIKSYFNQFTSPLIYSIGDNEWTDCHRTLAGSYDPIERLEAIRNTFFKTKKSLGKRQLELIRQADIDNKFNKYVENSYWIQNNFLFVNLHIPGSNNNYEQSTGSKKEFEDRNQANISWITNAFKLATDKNLLGIIFFYQADMFYKTEQATDLGSGYRDSLYILSTYSGNFKKPILLIHGDSHRLIIDQPLKSVNQKHIIENVLRLQVMGADQVQAVEISVDSSQEQPFSFTPILLLKNRMSINN